MAQLPRSFEGGSPQSNWTWRKIREYIADRYGSTYTEAELRGMEVRWRRICSGAGWSVKGQ